MYSGGMISGGGGGSSSSTSYRKVVQFYIQNVPAGATTYGNRSPGLTDFPFYIPSRSCQVTAVSARASGNPAGSTAIIRMEKNASGSPETSLDLSVPAGTTRSFNVTGSGVSLAALDTLRACIVTDGSWTGTTVDFCIDVELTETS